MRVIEVADLGDGRRLAARFPYDPELVRLVKDVSGREWDKGHAAWTFPNTPENVLDLMRRCPPDVRVAFATAELRDRLNAAYKATREAARIRSAGDADVRWPLSLDAGAPYAHQRAGLAFLAKLGCGGLWWEMGTGKTAAAIAYAESLATRGDWRCLVICPNTVKRNWIDEVGRWTGFPQQAEVLEGTIKARTARIRGGLSHLGRYTIVNCESLSLSPLGPALANAGWDMVIVDESSRFKSHSALRTKTLLKMAEHTPVRVILTGTPISGKPEDAWSQLEFIRPGIFGKWWHFLDQYLVRNPYTKAIDGVKPAMASELTSRVGQFTYRITKDEVLDLPPKVFEERHVDLEGDQLAAYEQMRRELRIHLLDTPAVEAWNVLTQLLRLTQVTAGLIGEADKYRWLGPGHNAKLAALDELLNDDLPNEQVVVYGTYQRELEELARRYVPEAEGITKVPYGSSEGYLAAPRPPIIYGPTHETVRAALINEFQSGHRRLLFVQTHTGGIGINLTAAKYAVYYTRGWSLEDWLQSQDRLHRIGQQGTVTIISLIANRTVDGQIAKALAAKLNVANTLTGDDVRRLARRVLEE